LQCRRYEDSLESSLEANINVREAASGYNLLKSSLQDRIYKIQKGGEVQAPSKLRRLERIFTVEYEEELATHIRHFNDRLMPLTS
jgi:hypothetical protein